MHIRYKLFALLSLILYSNDYINAQLLDRLEQLKKAYPDHIKEVSEQFIVWADATKMPVCNGNKDKSMSEKLNNPSLADQLEEAYIPGKPANVMSYAPSSDPGRIRYEPFFRKMYGNSPQEVEKNLKEIDWMPNTFGKGTYKLRVTRVNAIDKKLMAISQELEALVTAKPALRVF